MSERREDILKGLPVLKAPDAIWISIESALDRPISPRERRPWWPRWTFALAAAVVLAGVALYWRASHRTHWEVVRTVGSQQRREMIGAGDWLQTDASSTAEIRVGTIGTLKISPETRLRVLTTKPDEHRLSLQHGEISATISAPPKLFFVETKSATAVDLGCQYDMRVDDEGNGLLKVTLGWVAFDWRGRESLVPAGASCRTHASLGPGTPFFDDAPARLKTALDQFDFSNGGEASLRTILDASRVRDTLTLWHLLARVPEQLRPLVYDRMVSFAAPPPTVLRDKALALDPQTLKMWKDELAWTW